MESGARYFNAVLIIGIASPHIIIHGAVHILGILTILFIMYRKKREQRNQALKRHSSTIHCVQKAVTVTTSELYIELKDDM